MKRVLFIAQLIVSVVVSAQSVSIVQEQTASTISVVPQEYTRGGSPMIVTTDYDSDTYNYNFAFFDGQLERKGSGSFVPGIKQVPTRIETAKGKENYDNIIILSDKDTTMTRMKLTSDKWEGGKVSGITKEDMEYCLDKYCITNFGEDQVRITDKISLRTIKLVYYPIRRWSGLLYTQYLYSVNATFPGNYGYDYNFYWYKDLIGDRLAYSIRMDRYPYVWSNFSSQIFAYYLTDEGELYKVTFNSWSKGKYLYYLTLDQIDETYIDYVSSPISLRIINRGLNGSECNMTFSQTLFNNDESMEYIGYKYGNQKDTIIEEDRDNDGFIDYKETTQTFSVVGLTVRNTDNKDLYSFDFPDGYSLVANSRVDLLDMQECRHLIVHVTDNSGVKYMLIYRIDPETSSIKQVGAPMKARVAPTIVDRGNDIIVDLPADQGATDITVSSASGRAMISDRIPQGGGTTVVPTGALPQGINIITISDNDRRTRESTKVIVK